MKDRSRLALIAAASAIALVWFLPNLSFVVAQDSGSTIETSTTTSSSTSSTSTSTSTSSTTSTSVPVTIPPVTTIFLQLGTTTAAPGDPVGGSGQGNPNTSIGITFNSTPVFLGNVQADGNGNFVFTFNVPLNVDAGLHTIVATGPSGERGSANLTVTTTAVAAPIVGYPPPVLPIAPTPVVPVAQTAAPSSARPAFTGLNVGGLVMLAAAALALGGMAFTFGRLEPVIALPRRRRLEWAHRRPRSGFGIGRLQPVDLVQIAVCVGLAVALGLSVARL